MSDIVSRQAVPALPGANHIPTRRHGVSSERLESLDLALEPQNLALEPQNLAFLGLY
jgi:hypothetical protein